MRKLILGAAAAALSLGLMASAASAAPAVAAKHHGPSPKAGKTTGTAELVLVHAIDGPNGFPVDVTVTNPDGTKSTTPGVTAGTVADLKHLVRGTYTVEVKAGATTLTQKVTLGRYSSKTLVAKLDAAGKNPSLAVFNNVVNGFGKKFSRVTVIHAAPAPAVDVKAGTKTIVKGLVNGQQAGRMVKGGSLKAVSVVLSGTTTTVLGPVDLSLAPRTNTVVVAYAVDNGQLKTVSFVVS